MAIEKADDSAIIRDWARGGREIGRRLAAAGRSVTGVSYSYGTVQQVGTTGTLDVLIDGDDTVRRGLKMTTACRGAAAGDRVLVLKSGRLSTVTGVLAHDNDPYVKQIDSYKSGFEAYGPSQVPTLRRWGGVVALAGAVRATSAFTPGNDGKQMFTVPAGLRPAQTIRGVMQGSGMNKWLLRVDADGGAWCERYGTTSSGQVDVDTWLVLNLAWVLP